MSEKMNGIISDIQMDKGRSIYKAVLMCAGFFGWGDFPEMADDFRIEYDVLQRAISFYYGIERDRISRDVVRMAAKKAGIPIRETGNKFVFSFPAPRNHDALALFQTFTDHESGVC